VPQFLFEALKSTDILKNKAICITQPRRVAAISLAQRVSEEMKQESVG
jgi:HrpA-like RNA helicase